MSVTYDQYFEDDLNKEVLVNDQDFLFDASNFLAKRKGLDLTDPDEIYDEFISHMRKTDVNELDTIGDLMYAQEAEDIDKEEMRRLYDTYDKMPIEFTEDIGGKVLDYGEGILTAPSTYLGIATGGAGKLGSVAGMQAAKLGTKEILKRGILSSATKAMLVEGGIGAVQGGVGEGVRVEISPDREFTGAGIATGAIAGAIPGAITGGATGYFTTRSALKSAELERTALEMAEQVTKQAEEAADEVIKKSANKSSTKKVEQILRPIDPDLIESGDAARDLMPAELTVARLDESTRKRVTGAVVELIGDVKPKEGERVTEMISRTLRESPDAQAKVQDILVKYDISGEQLGNVFAADVSEAGRTLGEVSQVKRLVREAVDIANDTNVKIDETALEPLVNESKVFRAIKDQAGGFERMRRAVLTSQIQTTVRNFVGGGARVGLDIFENFIEDKTAKVFRKLGYNYTPEHYKPDSMAIAKYLFNQQEAEMVVNMYRRNNPQAADRIFKTFIDATDLSAEVGTHTKMEAFGLKINALNKISDNYYKKAIFAGELQRLAKAKYGKNLTDIIAEGNFNKLDPKMFEEAGNKSFELLYQLTPSGKGEGLSGFMSRTAKDYLQKVDTIPGLNMVTGAIMPFPRFVINQIKFMYDHAPVVGMITASKENLPKKVSQQITGMGLITGAMAIRAQEGTDMEWYEITNEEGQKIDLRPLLGPFNMFMYLGDLFYRMRTGQPTQDEFFGDATEIAIGSSMRAGTGQYLLEKFGPEAVASLTGEEDMTIKGERFAGRVVGDYFATLSYAMPVAVARDMFALTDEENRVIPETNGEVEFGDIFMARATRALPEPVRQYIQGDKKERFSITTPDPTRKQDPIGTMVTGAGKQAPSTEFERELARLKMDSYDIYKPVPFGPADVEIRKNVSQRLAQVMSNLFDSNRYKNAKTDAGRKNLIKATARTIISQEKEAAFERLKKQAENGDIDFTVDKINQFEFESLEKNLRNDTKAYFEDEYGRSLGGDDYKDRDYALALRIAERLRKSYDPKNFAEGGLATDDPLMLSETAEEMDPVAREEAGDEYLRQMTELGLDIAPVTGEIRSGQQALKDFEEGNPFMGTLGVIGALPLVGMFGRGAKKAYKIAKDIELPRDATEFSGELVLQHASRNPDLQQFKPVENVRREVPSTYGINETEPNPMLYPENVFGSKALYMDYEDGDFVTGAMDSPGFKVGKHVYQVNTNFDRAYVITPETLDKFAPLYKELEDNGRSIEDLPDLLKEKGYDGLIIRGFSEKYDDAMSKYKVEQGTDPFENQEMADRYSKAKDELDKPFEELGLPTDIGQDQILDFYPERIKVSKKVSEGESLGFRTNKAPLEGYSVPDALEMTDEQIAALRESRKKRNPEVVKRFDEIEEAAKKVQSGEMPVEEFRKIADTIKPVRVWDDLPKMASNKEIASGIKPNQLANGILGLTKSIPDGTRMTSRLDIPAYSDYDTWVVTLKGMDKGDRNVYAPAVMLKNVDLNQSLSNQTKAMKVAAGSQKGPFAVMEGDYVDAYPQDLYAYADGVMDNPNWTQIGYDPTRRGYFYDRETMEPVTAADEIIQIGPLVLGKNVTKGKSEDFAFNRGGLMSRK